jgi:flagellar hook-associated protein 3
MRVTPRMLAAQAQRELQAGLAAISRQQGLISAGKKFLAPSDDPAGAARSLTIRSRQAANVQFQRNVTAARTTLGTADQAMRAISEIVTQAREAAVQGASDNTDGLARQSLASTVNQLLETLVTLGNTRSSAGTFIFGGQESMVAPYTAARDTAGRITAVTPNPRGIDGETAAEISEGVTVPTTVSGTAIFGAHADPTQAFDVLMRLRDSLDGQPLLTFRADVTSGGAADAGAYAGIAGAADLEITGPRGTAFVTPTAAGDDAVSYSGNASSAIAAAARINQAALATGVTATATSARITYSAGSFASDATLDGLTAGNILVINGQSITGAVAGATAAERRDALVALINTQLGATGVAASAVPGGDAFTLTAADGRNISIETDATVTPASANAVLFGFAAGLTGTGAATSVVARGGVQLAAEAPVGVKVASGAGLQSQMSGQGTTGIQASLDELSAALDRVLTPATVVGARLAWVGLLDERLQGESVQLASNLSSVEDIDIAKAAIDLQQLQIFYEGALASSARIVQLSLLNFLK